MSERRFRRILRRMNYITDQTGIYTRYSREADNWAEHLKNTKAYISDYLSKHDFRSVSILGSGWLLDLPSSLFTGIFDRVILYDVNHPEQVKQKLKGNSNCRLVSADITGGLIESVYNAVLIYKKSKRKTEIADLKFAGFKPVEETDCYISLNMLNQLDILVADYLKPKKIYSADELKKIRSVIQGDHLRSLPKNKSCLITDIREMICRKAGLPETSRNLLFTDLPDGRNIQKWNWIFDTTGSYNTGCKTTFEVIAMEF